MRPIEIRQPRFIRHHLLAAPIGVLDVESEDEARPAERPGAVAFAVIQDLDADGVGARLKQRGDVNRVYLLPARIAGRGSPLHALAVDGQAIAAVGQDPADGGSRGGIQGDLAPEEHERVRKRALRGEPDPTCRRQVHRASSRLEARERRRCVPPASSLRPPAYRIYVCARRCQPVVIPTRGNGAAAHQIVICEAAEDPSGGGLAADAHGNIPEGNRPQPLNTRLMRNRRIPVVRWPNRGLRSPQDAPRRHSADRSPCALSPPLSLLRGKPFAPGPVTVRLHVMDKAGNITVVDMEGLEVRQP